ncbi:N-acetyltransferase GCN5 [Listeria fleischmannii FSL S10-1203]|uniref:N-acetyltransferase GCN5 n=1 Tax=Listeria fleischmannii FSL S10-1203 TaxID=1265822 RepID=W7DJK8_9LIST|nr:N-acetyltransferase GCN5 [Listeria fleischmannii FSL S10-1203]
MAKILSGIEKNESVYWVIENKADSTFLGTICLWNMDLDEEMADVGYELLPAFWKQNYMSEALEVVMNYSYHVLRLKKLGAVTSADNIASIRLLERHHFTKNRELNDFDLTESGEKNSTNFLYFKKRERTLTKRSLFHHSLLSSLAFFRASLANRLASRSGSTVFSERVAKRSFRLASRLALASSALSVFSPASSVPSTLEMSTPAIFA